MEKYSGYAIKELFKKADVEEICNKPNDTTVVEYEDEKPIISHVEEIGEKPEDKTVVIYKN